MIPIDETFGDELRDTVAAAEGDNDGFTDREATRELERTLASVFPRIEEVRALFSDGDPARRRSACVAFEALGRAGWNDIWSLLDRDDEDDARAIVAASLPALCDATQDPVAVVRAAALIALGAARRADSHKARADESVIAALGDPVAEVRAAAVASVARRSPERVVSLVTPLVADEAPPVEEEVITCLLAAESPAVVPLLLRVARREGRALSWARLDQLRSIALPDEAARELVLPLITGEEDADVRCQAAALLTEYVDETCLPALRRALAVGDHGAVCAALAVARLGAAIPVEDLVRWIDPALEARGDLVRAALWALAASGRPEIAPSLFAHVRRDLDADAPESAPTERTAAAALTMAALEHRAVVSSLRAIVESADSPWEYSRPPAALALGLVGGPEEARLLAALARRDDGRDRLRLAAALGCAALDRDSVDDEVADAAASGWPSHVATVEEELLPYAFVLRALGRRATPPLSPPMTWLVDRALEVLTAIDPARDGALRCHRGRGSTRGLSTGYVFLIGDLLDEAEADLLRLRHRLPSLDAPQVASLFDEAALEVARWDDAAWGRQPAGPPAMQVLVDWLEERAPAVARPVLARLLALRGRGRRRCVG